MDPENNTTSDVIDATNVEATEVEQVESIEHPHNYKSIVLALLVLVLAGGLVAYINFGMKHTPYTEEIAEEVVEETSEISPDEKLRLLESLQADSVEGEEISAEAKKDILENLSKDMETESDDEKEAATISVEEKQNLLNSLITEN